MEPAASAPAAAPALPVADRITVALIPRAAGDLALVQDRTRLSKTDIVNRGISLYEFVEAQLSAGREILVRDPGDPDGIVQKVRLL